MSSITKTITKTITKNRKFLCLAVLMLVPLCLARPERNLDVALSIRCEEERVFTQTEVPFVLELPHTPLSSFVFDIPELPAGVKYVSSAKSAATDLKGDSTTIVRFWFSFSDSGDYQIPPITAKVEDRTGAIPFEPVHVFENPALVQPTLSVSLVPGDEIRFGEKVTIDVYAQYCAQILDFSMKLPKDAILTELSRDSLALDGSRHDEFTPEKTKIASFEFQPLAEKAFRLPDISIDAISYSGDRKRVSIADLPISISVSAPASDVSGTGTAGGAESGNVFGEAFLPLRKNSSKPEFPEWSEEDLISLRAMRSLERKEILFFKEPTSRRFFEESHGLKDTEDEPSEFLFRAFVLLSFLALFGLLAMIFFKKAKSAVFFSVLFATFTVLSVRQNFFVSQKYAVSIGGYLSIVPEESAISKEKRSLPKGIRVKIVEDMGDWVYIECSETSGWTKSDSLLLIN